MLFVSLAAACTPDEPPEQAPTASPTAAPAPSPASVNGPRIAVVLPPPEAVGAAEMAALREEVESVGREFDDRLEEWRIVRPDGRRFLEDVIVLLAEEGYDLVCALGPGAGGAARAVAPLGPRTRFCAAPAAPSETPGNLLEIDVRVEEVAFLAGIAAGLASGPAAPVGLVAGETPYRSAEQRLAYFRGLRFVAPEAPEPLLAFPARDTDRAAELATNLLEAGAEVIFTIAGPADAGVLEAVAAVADTLQRDAAEAAAGSDPGEPPGPSPGPSPSPASRPPAVIGAAPTLFAGGPTDGGTGEPAMADHVLATTRVRLATALRLAVQRLLDGWATTPASVGLAEKALTFEVGAAAGSAAVADGVEQGRQLIMEGEIDVLPPAQAP